MKLPCLLEAEEGLIFVRYLQLRNIAFTHVPNETGHSPEAKRRAIRMKLQGTSKGFCDYVIAMPGVGMLFVELKRVHGSSISPEQRQWIAVINQCPGSQAYIAKGAQAAIDWLESFTVIRTSVGQRGAEAIYPFEGLF